MKCIKCSDPATLFLTQVEEGELKKIALCTKCAEDSKVIHELGLQHMLSTPGLTKVKAKSVDAPVPSLLADDRDEQVCAECGFSSNDLLKTGRLGCPACYSTFVDLLEPRIREIHRGTEHRGKQLDSTPEMLSVQKEALQQRLEIAILTEDFETAAQLRDQLESLSAPQ